MIMEPCIKATKTGLHIPKEIIDDFPPDTIFRINRKGAQLILTPEGLTEKTSDHLLFEKVSNGKFFKSSYFYSRLFQQAPMNVKTKRRIEAALDDYIHIFPETI